MFLRRSLPWCTWLYEGFLIFSVVIVVVVVNFSHLTLVKNLESVLISHSDGIKGCKIKRNKPN